MNRKYNFNAGPSALPLAVLEKAQKELVDYKGLGMSVMEMSHRSPEYKEMFQATKNSLKKLLSISDDYEILFMGGGASMQFAMIPMNFLDEKASADYINTGTWSKKAIKEAKLFGKVNVPATSEDKNFNYIPKEFQLSPEAAYVHITSNNTIAGTQWQSFPDTGKVPLIVDMSSDIFSRKINVDQFGIIYAGAQKNAGPAGVTLAIMHKSMLEKLAKREIPTMLQYKIHFDKDSAFNTPPVFPIYMVGLIAEYLLEQGGIEKIEEKNNLKAKLLYDTIDELSDFYRGTTEKDSRSKMNVTFRLVAEEKEKEFIAKASEKNFQGLKGHRSVGGMRASIYNAVPMEAIEKLCEFMKEFAKA